MASSTQYVRSSLFGFLKQLDANNEREWFNANKERYQDLVRDPLRAFTILRSFTVLRAFTFLRALTIRRALTLFIDLDFNLGRHWYFLISAERTEGEFIQSDQLYSSLTYRF